MIGCCAVWHLIPDLRGRERTRFDGLGFLLFGAAMVLITIAMEGLGELHLPHLRVMLLLFGGMACLAAYWLRAGRIEHPLFSPLLFQTRTFAVGIIGNLFARLGSGALPFLVPLLLQVAIGLFAVPGRHEPDSPGSGGDAGQVRGPAADRAPGLPQRPDRQHPAAGRS